jgi:hypothetical protein
VVDSSLTPADARACSASCGASTEPLVAALDRAKAIRLDAGHESERQLALLGEREQLLRRALSRLDSGTATTETASGARPGR